MGVAVPRLRAGVLLRLGLSGVEVADRASGKRYLLDASLYPALSRINGARDIDALLEAGARRGGRAPSPALLEQAVAALDRLGLLERRDLAARPLLFPLPFGFTCQGSGQCCRRFLVGPLSEEDRAHIDGVDWHARGYAGVPADPYVSGPDGKYLKKRADGYCVFYGADGLCDIHREIGGERKPLVCRLFPFEPLEEARGLRVLLRLECSVLARAIPLGAPLAPREAEARELFARSARAPAAFPTTPIFAASARTPLPLAPGVSITVAAHDAIRARAVAILAEEARGPVIDRFAAIARGILAAARALAPGDVPRATSAPPYPPRSPESEVEPASSGAGPGTPLPPLASDAAVLAAFESGLAPPPAPPIPEAGLARDMIAAIRTGLLEAGVIGGGAGEGRAPTSGAGVVGTSLGKGREPEDQRTVDDLSFEVPRARRRIHARIDAVERSLGFTPDPAATLPRDPPPFPIPGRLSLASEAPPKSFSTDEAWRVFFTTQLMRERPYFRMGNLRYGYASLALRFGVARAHATALARERGREAPSADEVFDAIFDVESVVRILYTPALETALTRFLETESYRLLG